MENRLTVSASPHILGKSTTRGRMGNVVIALLPCVIASAVIFGWQALLLVGVTTAACVGFEYLYCLLMKRPNPIGDLSAIVTGIILALNFPVGLPLWIAIVGAFIAIVITKQLFGGMGFNFANPALVARIVLFTGFASRMTTWVFPAKSLETLSAIDAVASATPLQVATAEGASLLGNYPLIDLLLGVHGGVLGETCAIAILLGFVWLVATKTIVPIIPLSYVATVALISALAGQPVLNNLLAGGLLFGAVFMATDYVTSPYTPLGKVVFGLGLGILTCAIRFWANMPEGVSYAMLFMNLMVPYINDLTMQVPLGRRKSKAKEAGKA